MHGREKEQVSRQDRPGRGGAQTPPRGERRRRRRRAPGQREHDAEDHHAADRLEERSEEHTSELQSPCNLVCRLLLEKKKITTDISNELQTIEPAMRMLVERIG